MAKIIDRGILDLRRFDVRAISYECLAKLSNGALEWQFWQRPVHVTTGGTATDANSLLAAPTYRLAISAAASAADPKPGYNLNAPMQLVSSKTIEAYISTLKLNLKIELKDAADKRFYDDCRKMFDVALTLATIAFPNLLIFRGLSLIVKSYDTARSWDEGKFGEFIKGELAEQLLCAGVKSWVSFAKPEARFLAKEGQTAKVLRAEQAFTNTAAVQRAELRDALIGQGVELVTESTSTDEASLSPTLSKLLMVHKFRMAVEVGYAQKAAKAREHYLQMKKYGAGVLLPNPW